MKDAQKLIQKELITKLTGQTVRHFKGGIYYILGVAKHTETQEDMVVYKGLYGNFETYVRPLSKFFEDLTEEQVKIYAQDIRFAPVDISAIFNK